VDAIGRVFLQPCSNWPGKCKFASSAKICGGKGIRTPGLLIANETLYQLSYTPSKSFPPSFTDQLRAKTIELEPDSASEKTRSARECTTVHSEVQIKRSSASRRIRCSYIRISILKLKVTIETSFGSTRIPYLKRGGIPILTNTWERT
jgi:hypothetical protein